MLTLCIRVCCLFLLLSLPLTAFAQGSCELTNWMLGLEPHSTRTPEGTPALRDTVVTFGATNNKVSLPAGFTMKVFANAQGARGVTVSPDGAIYVTARSNGGQILALPDWNRDGTPDSTIVVASGLGNTIHGIGFIKGILHYSNDTRLVRLDDLDGDRDADQSTTILTLPGGGHNTRTFVYDEINDKIYLQIGSSCNVCEESDERKATVMELNTDGSNARIYARGLRNAVGMDIDPRTNAVWVNNNDADNIFGQNPATNDNPKEGVYILCEGAHYGWPYAYGFRMRIPIAPPADTALFQTFRGPVAQLLAHSAPLGLHFLRGKSFPSWYHNAIFQAYHGSWNRQPPAPPRVTVMWADADGQNAFVEDFVNGFQPDSSNPRWGRVVSLVEGRDGALYVTDDQAGKVYRVAYTGEPGRTVDLGVPTLEGLTFSPGQTISLSWAGTGVDTFVVLFRLNRLADFDTMQIATDRFANFTVPDSASLDAALRIESTNGRTFTESGFFRILSSGRVRDERPAPWELSPNPVAEVLKIKLNERPSQLEFYLVDLTGKQWKTSHRMRGETAELDVREIPTGSYFLHGRINGQEYTSRVIIAR